MGKFLDATWPNRRAPDGTPKMHKEAPLLNLKNIYNIRTSPNMVAVSIYMEYSTILVASANCSPHMAHIAIISAILAKSPAKNSGHSASLAAHTKNIVITIWIKQSPWDSIPRPPLTKFLNLASTTDAPKFLINAKPPAKLYEKGCSSRVRKREREEDQARSYNMDLGIVFETDFGMDFETFHSFIAGAVT
jgi:hypothetical protein